MCQLLFDYSSTDISVQTETTKSINILDIIIIIILIMSIILLDIMFICRATLLYPLNGHENAGVKKKFSKIFKKQECNNYIH